MFRLRGPTQHSKTKDKRGNGTIISKTGADTLSRVKVLQVSRQIIYGQTPKGQLGTGGGTGMKCIVVSKLRTEMDETKLIGEL